MNNSTNLQFTSLLTGKIFPWNIFSGIFNFYEDILYDKYIYQILFLSQLINNKKILIWPIKSKQHEIQKQLLIMHKVSQ